MYIININSYLLLISLLNPIFSFKNIPYFATGKQFKLNSINTNDPNFEKDSIGQLIKNIDNKKIDNIYFSNDLKTAIATFDKIDDFTITNSNPAVTDLILEHANSNNIKTTILKEPFNPIKTFSSTFYGIFDFFFISSISFIIFNSIFSFFIRPDSGSNLLNKGNSFTSPFKLFNDKNIDEDKNSVTKANITLSSWAGSPEIFQECSEIVSYLNNRTLYEIAGAQIPRGILLEGPPGTGKTLLPRLLLVNVMPILFLLLLVNLLNCMLVLVQPKLENYLLKLGKILLVLFLLMKLMLLVNKEALVLIWGMMKENKLLIKFLLKWMVSQLMIMLLLLLLLIEEMFLIMLFYVPVDLIELLMFLCLINHLEFLLLKFI